MRTRRAQFKYALKLVKSRKTPLEQTRWIVIYMTMMLIAEPLCAECIWKAVHKMNSCNNVQANVIDGITGQENIADY